MKTVAQCHAMMPADAVTLGIDETVSELEYEEQEVNEACASNSKVTIPPSAVLIMSRL